MWNIEFYETENQKVPLEEFLSSLDKKLRAKAVRDIMVLQACGNQLRPPFSKHLQDGVFELRIKFASDIARVFYFFYVGETIILTNGFIKKSQKTPPAELERALRYKSDYERRFPHEKL